MRAAVTGGAGFIGHHLVRALLAASGEVSVIDDFSSGYSWRLGRVHDRLSVVEGTVLDPRALDSAFERCDVVFHLAAISSVVRSAQEPGRTNEVNANGTIEVMLAAARQSVRRVVFAGSAAIYGTPTILPCRESHRPDPRSVYAVSKLAAEHYVHVLGKAYDIDTVVLRYFNVYGPAQDPASEYAAVVPRFIEAILEGQRPIVNGSGEISRDFVFVDDVVAANLLAARLSSPSRLTCNIAAGSATTLNDLLRTIAATLGRTVDPLYGPARPGDVARSQADVSLAHEELGFTASHSFEQGISTTVDWYRARMGSDRAC